ncbi:hypothetical protein C8F01DRAFT_1122637 [Mycena amicta]|nr:hypothetical protein C8F01DRAFT_1122637 [Mycena amicta]
MKGFVHEVLRRSHTSGSVLQTALCYLEAIHPQVQASAMPATPTDLALEAELFIPDAAQAANEYVPRLSACALTRRRVHAHWQTLGES